MGDYAELFSSFSSDRDLPNCGMRDLAGRKLNGIRSQHSTDHEIIILEKIKYKRFLEKIVKFGL